MAKAQEVKDVAMSSLVQATEDEKKEQWRVEGRAMLFDAKRVSITILSFQFLYSSILTYVFQLTAATFSSKSRRIITLCGSVV